MKHGTVPARLVLKAPSGELTGPVRVLESLPDYRYRVYLEGFPEIMGIVHLPPGTEVFTSGLISQPPNQQRNATNPQEVITIGEPSAGTSATTAEAENAPATNISQITETMSENTTDATMTNVTWSNLPQELTFLS